MPKVNIVTLGCPKNQVDSEVMAGLLREAGFTLVDEAPGADLIIVNTCGFLQAAKEEAIRTILELAELKNGAGPSPSLLVAGCFPQRHPEELSVALPEANGLIGVNEYPQIADICRRLLDGSPRPRVQAGAAEGHLPYDLPRVPEVPQSHAYLKISEGCSNPCAFCVIPAIRGPLRSKPVEALVGEALSLAERGARELVLVSQDTTDYGLDLYGRRQLPRLLREIAALCAFRWIRLLYTYPAHFSEELIATLAETPAICRYLDLPLQHASDPILRSMKRKVNRRQIERLIHRLRTAITDVHLRTTFIVGYPGEKRHHFQELLDFVHDVRFDRLGAFPYSREEGTPAADLPEQVDSRTKARRLDKLMNLQAEIALEKNLAKVGSVLPVLVDEVIEMGSTVWGRTEWDAPEIDDRVRIEACSAKPGQWVDVRITRADVYDLTGIPAQG